MTKQDKENYLEKHKDAVCCSEICSAPKMWWCGYRAIKHIKECRDFKPVEEKNEQN